jgi:hypothetical protein
VDYAAVLNIDSFPHEVPTWAGGDKNTFFSFTTKYKKVVLKQLVLL